MDVVAPDGSLIDHFEGRTLNPGHAFECAWFILHEGRLRSEKSYIDLGLRILDCTWERSWDTEHGGIYHFRDVFDKPLQEYWHDMKLWSPHCEAINATALAWHITGNPRYSQWHRQVHDWSFAHFPDREHGEWYGYLHRDGTPSVHLKGNQSKGPFHLPRMLWHMARLLGEEHVTPPLELTSE
jgi:N-acylglucosamine 2-epimerase